MQEKDLVLWMGYPLSLSKIATTSSVGRRQSRGGLDHLGCVHTHSHIKMLARIILVW